MVEDLIDEWISRPEL